MLPLFVTAQTLPEKEKKDTTITPKDQLHGLYTWEQFVEDYLQYVSEMEDESDNSIERYDWLEELEDIHNSPINLNKASRSDLLQLHFLSDEQVDSLLARRNRYQGGFRSIGELMTVRQLSYRDRAWLSLLVECQYEAYHAEKDSFKTQPIKQRTRYHLKDTNRWWGGTHELTGTLDVPLYCRAGFYDYDDSNYVTKMFVGQQVGHTLRYRYNWRQRVKYGATVQQDIGERFGAYGARPWDFGALYFYYKSDQERRGRYNFNRYTVSVGDYKMSVGQGLIVSSASWQQFAQLLTGFRLQSTVIRPHTGTDESNFLRGAAATIHLGKQGHWNLTSFASWRQLDGSVQGADKSNDYNPHASNVITAWKTDGLHRTFQELNKRHVATQLVGGGRIGWQCAMANVGINAVAVHYDKNYNPAPRKYNKYYMRGHDAAAFSADYAFRLRHWSLQGELAVDRSGGYASTTALRWTPVYKLSFVLLERSFAHDFVSPYGNALQAGSQIQNEHGLMAGVRYRVNERIEILGYGDLAYHPRPVYLADTASHRFEALAEVHINSSNQWTHTVLYKIKGREQNVSHYKDVPSITDVLMAWRTTQHLRWQSIWSGRSCSISFGADGCYYNSQGTSIDKKLNLTAGPSIGGLLYTRATYRYRQRLTTSAMLTGFLTDDYSARCYAYLPQLRGTVNFPNFYGRGVAGVAQIEGRIWHQLYVALRYQCIKYFDRSVISSDVGRINSSCKNDLSLQLRYRF